MTTRLRGARRGGVLVDKDGTLIANVPFNVDPERITLLPGVATGLQRLTDAGFRTAVVSNQAGVALGRFTEDALRGVEARIDELLAPFDVHIAGYFWCMHAMSAECACRKPRFDEAADIVQRDARRHPESRHEVRPT
jgi:histidinol-phosphate phosphatase family protein